MAGAFHIPIRGSRGGALGIAGITQGRAGIHWMAVHCRGFTVWQSERSTCVAKQAVSRLQIQDVMHSKSL